MWRIAVKRTMGEGEVEEQDEDLEALHPTVCQAFFLPTQTIHDTLYSFCSTKLYG